jgi:cytidyltransferase-like protein
MSGISHLYDIYNKKGKEFIDNLFNSYVTVNEKMDGSAFVFDRDLETGRFNFYKRDQRNPITLVDRTLMKYYEKPIQYIESLPPHILKEIPRGWKFGLEYFSNTQPVEIAYDRLPKNNLILSYVHTKSDDGKPSNTIQNKEKLDTWADLIGVERPPIIFQGLLSEEQKESISDFLRTPFEDLVNEYKTRSFVRYIIGVLNPEAKESALNADLDKPIEGIVFRFGEEDSDAEPILSKMVDPVFTEIAKEKAKKRFTEKPSDFLGITVLDVMNFILEREVDTFNAVGDTEDQRYISFISDVFAKFLDENGYKYKGADFQEPDYLKKEEFRLNKPLIKDRRVLSYLEADDSYESLFKLILNSFRKIKKRAGGIITAGIIDQFNLLVSDIERVVSAKKTAKIQESSMPSFMDFKRNNLSSKKVEYTTSENDDVANEEEEYDHFYSYNEFISKLETIDTKDKPNVEITEDEKPEEKEEKKLEEVNLIIGRFQPFHNGHLKMVKKMMEKNNLPSIIAVVHPGHNKSGKSPFNSELVSKYMENVVKESAGKIQGFFMIDRGLLGVIYGKSKELGYLPKAIAAGDDRIEDYKKQSDYLKKAGGDFPDDMEIIQTSRSSSGTEVREKLAEEDFLGFKKLVPPGVSAFYNQLVSSQNGKDIKESIVIDYLDEYGDEKTIEEVNNEIEEIKNNEQ